MMKRARTLLAGLVLLWAVPAAAENFTLTGNMDSSIRYEVEERITAGDGIRRMVMSFVVPQSFSSPTYGQTISDFRLSFSPEPSDRTTSTDRRGNRIVTVTWEDPPQSIKARMSCTADSKTHLTTLDTKAPFPLASVGSEQREYLAATEQVQVNDLRIRQQAEELISGVKTQYDAVQRIIAWVVDHVSYVTPPERYDAIYSYESGKGNCQNYSHLSAALLRSVGIPTRIVNGVTLNQPYDINWAKGVLTFKMGQGRHSWIEVWFPDLGWVPFDAQNSVLFVSNRFVRIEVGVDNNETKNDGLLRWTQAREARAPVMQEAINAAFSSDSTRVRGVQEKYGPKNLLLTPVVRSAFSPVTVEPPPPLPVIPKNLQAGLRYVVPYRFGNLVFPENVDFAFPRITSRSGSAYEMKKNFMVETAEYVTGGRTQYAQVFILKKPIRLDKVGLALHNFGGDGMLWVELRKDDGGKPGETMATSGMLGLEQISIRPGYRWVDFSFSKDSPILMPGSYWIALGFTGSPIVNWFYTYGKPVGPLYGTRYKGIYEEDWSGALNYEFNYRISAMTTKEYAGADTSASVRSKKKKRR